MKEFARSWQEFQDILHQDGANLFPLVPIVDFPVMSVREITIQKRC